MKSAHTDFWSARTSAAAPGLGPGGRRGLFATADIAAGTLIERAFTAPVLADQFEALNALRPVGDYYFSHPTDPDLGLMAFGLMSLCNHAQAPNAEVRFVDEGALGWMAELLAVRAIRRGEEITYRYRCELWFEASD